MNRWTVLYALVLLMGLVALGCSGNGNPMTPDEGLTDRVVTSGPTTQTTFWGYWDIHIDIANQTVEAVPNRGVSFTANVVSFVNKPATNLAFGIWGTPVDPLGEWVDVDIDVSITHPFAGVSQYDGYDVRGIFMGQGSGTMLYDTDLEYAVFGPDQVMYDYDLADDPEIGYDDPNEGLVGMPDGYTRWWNAPEFPISGPLGYTPGVLAAKGYTPTSTLNPYKYFADGLGVEDNVYDWLEANAALGYFELGRFTAGTTNTRNYYLRFPMPDPNVTYGYAIAADWANELNEDPPPAESHMVETPAISVAYNGEVYFVDDTVKGGNFTADINVWSWDYQPSAVMIETAVNSSLANATGPAGGNEWVSTWSVDFAPDTLTQSGMEEYWVICEYGAFDYSAKNTDYSVPGTYPAATLATFFRNEFEILPFQPCDGPTVDSMSPDQGAVDTVLNADILGVFGAGAATAQLDNGSMTIDGDNVVWVDANTLNGDFDLNGADLGLYDLHVTAADCSTVTTLVDALEVIEISGPSLRTSGDLPGPFSTNLVKDISVIGSNAFGHGGVYFHYSTSPTTSFQIWHYPIDYTASATMHVNITDPFFGNIAGLLKNDNDLKSIEMSSTGFFTLNNNNNLPMTWGGYDAWGPVWWGGTDGLLDNGYIYFNMQFHDLEREFSTTGRIWGFWGNEPAGVDGATYYLDAPYGAYNYGSYTGYYPADHAGSTDGQVSDNEAFWYSVDSTPQGLSSPFNIIHYYLEGPPDAYGVEVMENVNNLAFPVSLTTIDENDADWTGTPLDICVAPTYGNAPSATNNWLCLLEDNGDSTWNLSCWDQTGAFMGRSGPHNGDAYHVDVDLNLCEAHVWADDAGTMKYFIFEFF